MSVQGISEGNGRCSASPNGNHSQSQTKPNGIVTIPMLRPSVDSTNGGPPKEAALLDQFQMRCTAVRDIVHHVVTNEDVYGLYLWGPRGCGKTTGIERGLKEFGQTPLLFRGTTTGQSLFTEAKNSPDGILWFNDDPGLLGEPAAQQYLLAMLEDTTDPKNGESYRLVTKSRASVADSDRFIFKGKILFDSNVPIVNNRSRRMLEAVEDRLKVHHFGPTDAELSAVMRYWASLPVDDPKDDYTYIRLKDKDRKYWTKTEPKERSMIAEFIIDEAKKYKATLSLRMLRDTIKYYVDQQKYHYKTGWQDVVVKELTRYDTEYKFSKAPSRKDERLGSERTALIEILEDAGDVLDKFPNAPGVNSYKHEVIEMWRNATGQNERQFRRRLAELSANLRDVYERLPDRRTSKDG
jgi:hypothetical protein